jgi:carbonic anhydrase
MSTTEQGQESLNRLIEGVRRFRREVYPQRKEIYQQAVREPQRPHTLIVTCADSRIDPELITQAEPGDVFVTRNIGNLVPAYGQMLGGVSAVIEYAVAALDVEHIVVCGHTDCGAMKALLKPESTAKLPTVNTWLRNAEAALSTVQSRESATTEPELLHELIEENVLLQMMHLRTHPSVAGKLAQGALTIQGWVYDIGHGDVRMHDSVRRAFVSVDDI